MRLLQPDVLEHLEASHLRQIDVQDQQVVVVGFRHVLGLGAVGCRINSILLGLQALPQKRSDRRIIFSDKDAHQHVRPCKDSEWNGKAETIL